MKADDIRLADPLINLGEADRGLDHYQAAIHECTQAVSILSGNLRPRDHQIAQARVCLGRATLQAGDAREAAQQMSLGLDVYEETEHNPDRLNRARFDLARALVKSRSSHDRALVLARQARKAMVAADATSDLVGDIDAWLKQHER